MGCHEHLPYSGKLLREKTFMNFRGFEAVRESFLHEIWGCGDLWCGTYVVIHESFLCENH